MLQDPLAGFAPAPHPLANLAARAESAQVRPVDPADLGIRRLLFSLREAKEVTGFSRSFLYKLIANGELRSFKSGKTRRIIAADIARYIASRIDHPTSNGDRHAGV
jgi:excisionase family DNA binding protein